MKVVENWREIFPVSRETEESLSIFVDTLLEWQKTTNLIANSTLDDVWNRHIADSFQCLAIKPMARNWLDLGSGGGFPGLVVAAAMKGYEEYSVTLVESNGKKASFLRHAARKMGTNVTVKNCRIEDVGLITPKPEIVTARAVTELPSLLELAKPWISSNTRALFHKGRDYEKELSLCDSLWQFDLVIHESPIEQDSVVLEIGNLRRRESRV